MIATLITPAEYAKGVKALCEEKRGILKSQEFIN